MIRYRERMAELFNRTLPVAEGARNELAPRPLRLAPDAKSSWLTVHDAIERELAPGGRFAVCKPWASKSAEQCLRIAGVLALVEAPDAQTIDTPTIARAAELALWHVAEAARLAGTAEQCREVRDAEALLTWCHETGRTELHSRDALRFGPTRIRDRDRFLRAMDELEAAGWAVRVEGGKAIGGKHRRNVWVIIADPDGR